MNVRTVLAAAFCAALLGAQERELLSGLAGGGPEARRAALLFLEDARVGDPAPWEALLEAASADPAEAARVLRGIGRVGHEALKPLLRRALARARDGGSAAVQDAAVFAAGLFRDPELVGLAAPLGDPAALALAVGLAGALPEDAAARAAILERLENAAAPAASGEAIGILDGVEAALVHGAALAEPAFQALASRVIADPASPGPRVRGAVRYFARQAAGAPTAARARLAGLLADRDPETAALAALALARAEGAGETEAANITAAFLDGGPRCVQVDRLRALARLPPPPGRPAVLAALKDKDPALRRTALETVEAWAGRGLPGLEAADRRGLAMFSLATADLDPAVDVRRAGVLALARVDPETMAGRLRRYRLADPWPLRAAAAGALAALPWSDAGRLAVRQALADPDQRVRAAMLEALKARIEAFAAPGTEPGRVPSEAAFIASCVSEPVVQEAGRELKLVLGPLARALASDPVQVALALQVAEALLRSEAVRAAHGYGVYAEKMLESGATLVPSYEAELLQAVVDLAAAAGGEAGRQHLRRLLASPEVSIRRRAAERLRAAGESADAFRPLSPQEQDVLLERCRARARALEAGTLARRVRVRTLRGDLMLRLFADEAPATVENFLALAEAGAFDGTLFHRVVPGFVAQAGCPRGDGWGGPGYTVRCEVTPRSFRRGVAGMALAGKDTGGSQWFLALRDTPHLDGRYTVFGEVEGDDAVLDLLQPGDPIIEVVLVE